MQRWSRDALGARHPGRSAPSTTAACSVGSAAASVARHLGRGGRRGGDRVCAMSASRSAAGRRRASPSTSRHRLPQDQLLDRRPMPRRRWRTRAAPTTRRTASIIDAGGTGNAPCSAAASRSAPRTCSRALAAGGLTRASSCSASPARRRRRAGRWLSWAWWSISSARCGACDAGSPARPRRACARKPGSAPSSPTSSEGAMRAESRVGRRCPRGAGALHGGRRRAAARAQGCGLGPDAGHRVGLAEPMAAPWSGGAIRRPGARARRRAVPRGRDRGARRSGAAAGCAPSAWVGTEAVTYREPAGPGAPSWSAARPAHAGQRGAARRRAPAGRPVGHLRDLATARSGATTRSSTAAQGTLRACH